MADMDLDSGASLGDNWALDICVGCIAFVIAAISLAAGVGGGGLFVPLLMAAYPFDTRKATAISQAMLSGGAIAAFFYNIVQGHPDNPARHLIDFELALLMAPALMAGAQIGSIVHDIAPTISILILLSATLLDSFRRSINCARMTSLSERAKRESAQPGPGQSCQELSAAVSRVGGSRVGGSRISVSAMDKSSSVIFPVPVSSPMMMQFAREPQFGMSDISGIASSCNVPEEDGAAQSRTHRAQLKLVLVWLTCLAVVIGKGHVLKSCEPRWWALTAVTVVGLSGSALLFARQLKERVPLEGDVLDYSGIAKPLVVRSLCAGTLAAMCGIGGGMIMGPMLVELKVLPPVCAATSATTLLVLSSSTAAIYMVRADAPLDYGMFTCLFTVTGAFFGKVALGWWVNRTGRQSVIFWCLAFITLVSVVLMFTLGTMKVMTRGYESFAIRDFCPE